MLVLTRQENEQLVVIDPFGNEIASVMVVAIRGNKVRLGTEAPTQYRVHRREVWEAIQLDKRAAETHPIQASEADIADLGRVIDPLGIADAYDEGAAS